MWWLNATLQVSSAYFNGAKYSTMIEALSFHMGTTGRGLVGHVEALLENGVGASLGIA